MSRDAPRLARVFVDRPLRTGAEVALPAAPARHLIQVLRLVAGDPVRLFDGGGRDFDARIETLGRDGVRLRVLAPADPEPEPEPRLRIALALGVSRGERMDYALQKAAELGVAAVQPLFSERSQVRLEGERRQRRQDHWRGVLIGACEQSGRRRLPDLHPARPFAAWLAGHRGAGLLLDPRAELALPAMTAPATDLALLVGPEGGLSPGEREQARQAGFLPVRLGPRILRAETAPLAAIAALQTLWGDFAA